MTSNRPLKKLWEIVIVFADWDRIESKDQSQSWIRLIQTWNVWIGIFKDREEKWRYISETTFKRLNCTEIFENDCLISRLPEPVWRACIIPKLNDRLITAVDCTIVRFDEKQIYQKYFIYYSQSNLYQNDIEIECTGSTRKRISRKNLSDIQIPLPPLSTQQLIVAKLDETFAQIDEAIATTQSNIAHLDEMMKSVLDKVFEEGEWEKVKFWEVCDFVRWPFGWSLKKEIFKSSWYAIYEQQHAIWDQFDNIRYFIDEDKFNEMKRFELKSWDLVMSCSGTMWKIAIVPGNIKKWIINQALLKLTPFSKISKEFLKLRMQSKDFQDTLNDYTQGAAIKNVASVAILKNIQLPLPPLAKQQEIVDHLDQVFAETKQLKVEYEAKLQQLKELKASVLQSAFEGKLV